MAGFVAFLMLPTHARLLTSTEMRDFMGAHIDEIDAIHKRDGLHHGYCVVELAKQRMLKDEFSGEDQLKVSSYYGNVILSALSGIGFGGLSKTKKVANIAEHRTAYLALYALGLNLAENLDDVSLLPVTEACDYKSHYQACNDFIRLGYMIQNDSSRSSAASDILAIFVEKTRAEGKKQYDVNAFNIDGELYNKYRLYCIIKLGENEPSYVDALRQANAAKMYAHAIGKRESSKKGALPTQPKSKPQTPLPSSSVKPEPKPDTTEPLPNEPWSGGTLYRDLAAANQAIRRGDNDDVCKSTGNLIVRIQGKSSYYSSTATLNLCQGGNVMAITNAHCVSAKEGEIISSIELKIPGVESIFFKKVYINPQYEAGSSDYDFAFLTGKHEKARTFIPLLPSNITVDMKGCSGYLVSSAKVNYVENGRVRKLSDGERTLSIQRVESVGSAPLFKMTMPRYFQNQEPMSGMDSERLGTLPIHFDPNSHQLDAAFSFGCSGSPFFVQVKERGVFLIGLLDSTHYSSGLHSALRSNNISSIHAVRDWVDQVFMAGIKPTYTLS